MGSILSLAGSDDRSVDHYQFLRNSSHKRQKTSSNLCDENPRLIPCLPDELSIQILARLPRVYYFNLKLVSQKWKATIMSRELFQLRKELGLTEEWLYVMTKVEEDKLIWHGLDPLSRKWQRLPTVPTVVDVEESKKASTGLWLWNKVGASNRVTEGLRNWLGRKKASSQMPLGGCAVGAVDGRLYVLGGFSRGSTMKCVWQFDPILNRWSEMASMSTGRAYCKTGILNNKLYVVGGVSRDHGGLAPLQSAEAFDPTTGIWSEVPSMPFSSTQVPLGAFWSDMLKPIATGMIPYNGRLCVPQSLYLWPFFVDSGGEIYDPETNLWAEMPTGMGQGWPARQAGTKLSVVVDGELYAIDLSSSLDSGMIKVYDQIEDAWKVVISKVPIHDLSESECPYLLAGFHGKLNVITKDVNHSIVVMQADLRDNLPSSPLSSISLSANSLDENSASQVESETVDWKVIASRDFGSAELVSCLVIDI
ncbi:hypothetical protein K2173_022989 [Erythroxylum novogranatense]|uniref:F-box domain-containing protein n=1 Tax=Erythroxylum novogranatense TaxID=1862640 RepID=A0AAV8T9B1_9ROSI|nr:hypothetical protein K2173_022989 [Erythroxylum novogranatense]